MPMPECTYTIRKDELDGPILRHARVGEQVVHRWECRSGKFKFKNKFLNKIFLRYVWYVST